MKKVIYIIEQNIDANFRYRVMNVQESLKGGKSWRMEYILWGEVLADKEKFWTEMRGAEILVIGRQTAKDSEILQVIREVQERGVPVLMDLDDLVFDFRDLPILMRGTGSWNVAYWVGYVWGIWKIARLMDGFLTTNKFLAGKLERSFKKPVRVIRNSLNGKQLKVSEKLLAKKSDTAVGEKFMLGYFSGSPTHRKDFQMVEPDLVRFLDVHQDACLRVVGYMELSSEMQKLVEKGRVEFLPAVDYLKLQKLMSEVDVNIAPLVLNDFTNCKSELKFFEAAAVKTVTVASPSYTFARAIKDGKNGLLAREGEWFDKLEYLYQNPAERRRMAKQAHKDALRKYDDRGEEFLREVEGAYDYFT